MESCQCDCSCYDAEPYDFYELTYPKARKAHICMECYRTIKPGEKYELIKGKCAGEFEVFKTCVGCMNLRTDLGCCQGVLEDTVQGCFGVSIKIES